MWLPANLAYTEPTLVDREDPDLSISVHQRSNNNIGVSVLSSGAIIYERGRRLKPDEMSSILAFKFALVYCTRNSYVDCGVVTILALLAESPRNGSQGSQLSFLTRAQRRIQSERSQSSGFLPSNCKHEASNCTSQPS
jgi:hypothetical protein